MQLRSYNGYVGKCNSWLSNRTGQISSVLLVVGCSRILQHNDNMYSYDHKRSKKRIKIMSWTVSGFQVDKLSMKSSPAERSGDRCNGCLAYFFLLAQRNRFPAQPGCMGPGHLSECLCYSEPGNSGRTSMISANL